MHLDVHVDAEDDQVADDVESAHSVQDVRVIEGDFLAGLHHHKDDDQVGSAVAMVSRFAARVLAFGLVLTFADSWLR